MQEDRIGDKIWNYNTYRKAQIYHKEYRTFVHFSPYIEEILSTGIIFSSWWWLGFWVYVTPLYNIGNQKYNIHNLWNYINSDEIPFYNHGNKSKHGLIFEFPENSIISVVDYLEWGPIFLKLFTEESIENFGSIFDKELEIYQNLLNDKDWDDFSNLIIASNVLPTIVFESVQDFYLLYENLSESVLYKSRWELYTTWFKERLYKSQSYLRKWFTTKKFLLDKVWIESLKLVMNINMTEREIWHNIKRIVIMKYNQLLCIENWLRGFLLGRLVKLSPKMSKDVWNYVYKKSGYADLLTYPTPKWEFLITPYNIWKINIYLGEYNCISNTIEKKQKLWLFIKNEAVAEDKVTLRKK